jgi:hypothetical protein
MPAPRTGKFAPVTLGHMRSQGCRDLLVHCKSSDCDYCTTINFGHPPDETSDQAANLSYSPKLPK